MKLTYNGTPVKVDGYIKMADVSLVSVEATDGTKPFVGGDTYPIRTQYGTVRVDELVITEGEPVTPKPHKYHVAQSVIYNRNSHFTKFIGLSPTVKAFVVALRRGKWNQPMYEIKWGVRGWSIVYEESLESA